MFIVYGSPSCSWCHIAKGLLETKGFECKYIDVTEDEEAQTMFRENSFRTVPQIFHEGKHIGGYQDLVDYTKS